MLIVFYFEFSNSDHKDIHLLFWPLYIGYYGHRVKWDFYIKTT